MSVGIVLAGNAGPRHPNEGAGWLSRRSRSFRLDGWEERASRQGSPFLEAGLRLLWSI